MTSLDLTDALAGSWTRDPHKAETYLQDTWFLEAAGQLVNRVAEPGEVGYRLGVLLVKPDGVVSGAAPRAVEWLLGAGYTVHWAEAVELGRTDIRALWLYQWAIASPERRALADVLRALSPSLVLVVGREGDLPCAVDLTVRKGATDPAKRRDGELRHALGGSSYLLNLVHSPDEPADAVRELGIYFDHDRRMQVIDAVAARTDRGREAAALATELDRAHGGFRDDPASARSTIAELAAPGEDLEATCRRLLAAPGALSAGQRWDLLVAGSAFLPMRTRGEVTLGNPGPEPWRTDAAPGHFARSIDRHLVHRSATAETFVTALAPPVRDTEGRVRVDASAQIARAHHTHSDHLGAQRGHVDLLHLMEAARQAAIAAAHRAYGAPRNSAFVVRRFAGQFLGAPAAHGAAPLPVTIAVTAVREYAREEAVTGLDVEFALRDSGGADVAAFTGSYSWIPAAQWRQLRAAGRAAAGLPEDPQAAQPAEPVDPAAVLRETCANVALSASDAGLGLVVDPSHPTHFDHSLDHVPGMLQLEGARQAALWSLPPERRDQYLLTSIDATFLDFGELDAAVGIAVDAGDSADGEGITRVELSQPGRVITQAAIGMTALPDTRSTTPVERVVSA